MPRIPLLQQPGLLKDAPRAVLDKQQRPTVDRSGEMRALSRVADASKMPDVDGQAMTAQYRALGSIGSAIAKGGGILGGLALKKAEAETDVQIQQADQVMADAYGKHLEFRASNPDHYKWEENLDQNLESARKTIESNQHLSPIAKEQIGLRMAKFAGTSKINVKVDSAKAVFNEAASYAKAGIMRDFTAGNYEGGIERAKVAEEKKYLHPHEVADLEDQAKKLKERDEKQAEADAFDQTLNSAIAVAVGSGKDQALKDLDDGKLGTPDATQKEKIRNAIQTVDRNRAGEVIANVSEGIVTGGIKDEAAIDAIINPHFTPAVRKQAKDMLKEFNADAARQDRELNGIRNAVEMRKKVMGYDAKKDPDRTEFYKLNQEIKARVPNAWDGSITQELYSRYGSEAPKMKVRPEIHENVTRSIGVMFDPTTGAIPWKLKVPVLDSAGKPVTDSDGNPKTTERIDPVAQRNAIDAETLVEMKMNDWYRDYPDKAQSLTEVRKHLESVLPEGTRLGALDSLMKAKAAAEPPNLGARGDTGPAGPLDDTTVEMVKDLESFIPQAYGDYKQTSVGYGTRAKSEDEVISQSEAENRLREELATHAGRIDAAADKVGISLSNDQRKALISFDFNTGRGASLLESSNGDMREVKRRLLLYTKAGGEELPGLVKRRKREAALLGDE